MAFYNACVVGNKTTLAYEDTSRAASLYPIKISASHDILHPLAGLPSLNNQLSLATVA